MLFFNNKETLHHLRNPPLPPPYTRSTMTSSLRYSCASLPSRASPARLSPAAPSSAPSADLLGGDDAAAAAAADLPDAALAVAGPENLRTPRSPTTAMIDTRPEFHTLSPGGEEQRPSSRTCCVVVCVHHERSWAWARVAVFSSHTMGSGRSFPQTGTQLLEGDRYSIYWYACSLVGSYAGYTRTRTRVASSRSAPRHFQFSRMDLPPPLKSASSEFTLGHTPRMAGRPGSSVVSSIMCMSATFLFGSGQSAATTRGGFHAAQDAPAACNRQRCHRAVRSEWCKCAAYDGHRWICVPIFCLFLETASFWVVHVLLPGKQLR